MLINYDNLSQQVHVEVVSTFQNRKLQIKVAMQLNKVFQGQMNLQDTMKNK